MWESLTDSAHAHALQSCSVCVCMYRNIMSMASHESSSFCCSKWRSVHQNTVPAQYSISLCTVTFHKQTKICCPTQQCNATSHTATCFSLHEPSSGPSCYTSYNIGTLEHAVILFVRSHKMWLFIEIINVHHIYWPNLKNSNTPLICQAWDQKGARFILTCSYV